MCLPVQAVVCLKFPPACGQIAINRHKGYEILKNLQLFCQVQWASSSGRNLPTIIQQRICSSCTSQKLFIFTGISSTPQKKKPGSFFSQVPPTFICSSKGTCWRNLRLAVRSDLDCLPAAKGPEWPEIVRKGHQPWRRHLVCGETRSTTRVGKERVGMKNYPGFFLGGLK